MSSTNENQEPETKSETQGNEFFRIMKYFSRKGLLATSLVIAFLAGASPLLNLIPLKKLTDMFMPGANIMDEIAKFCEYQCYVLIAFIFLEAMSLGSQALSAPYFLVDIRKALYESFMVQDIEYYDKTSTGALISRLLEGVTYIKDVYIDQLFLTTQAVALSLGGLIVSFIMQWLVTFVVIGFPIVIALVLWIGDKISNKIWEQYKSAGTESTEKAVEVITEFRTVKSFDNEMHEANNYEAHLYDEDKILHKVSIIRGITYGIVMILLMAMALVLLYYSCWLMVRHPEKYTLYKLLNVSISIIMSTVGVNRLLSISDDFKMASLAVSNILKILSTKPTIDPNVGDSISNVRGKIEFRDVAFKYSGCEQYAVKHLSFTINPGETVAFVGESGCGKSTTLQLLQRFYDVESGSILLDDIDIRTLKPSELRSTISIVPQGPVLFSMSIADNIAFAQPDSSPDEIAEAARTGNAHDFIMELPHNYDTEVVQTSLSGGQKQRICISRAILANAPILLLDEATAALDTESEQLVQQSLENFRHGKTSIMVAHRLATVVHADKIFVFKDGRIVEVGTHNQLLEANGIYAQLAKYQLQ